MALDINFDADIRWLAFQKFMIQRSHGNRNIGMSMIMTKNCLVYLFRQARSSRPVFIDHKNGRFLNNIGDGTFDQPDGRSTL